LHARRQVHSYLQNKSVVSKIVDDLGPKFASYNGGFTRIVKLGNRRGDNAPLARLELLEKATEKLVNKLPKNNKAIAKSVQETEKEGLQNNTKTEPKKQIKTKNITKND